MKNYIYTILLLFAFVTAIFQPAIPFVQYYLYEQNTSEVLPSACTCQQNHDSTHPPIADAYLKALLKRVCENQKKSPPKVPVVNIPVFVQTLYTPSTPIYICPEDNYTQISDFIILQKSSLHVIELYRPPQVA